MRLSNSLAQAYSKFSHHRLIFLDQVIVSAGNFVVSLLLARGLGLEVFGWFSAIWLLFLFSNTAISSIAIFPLVTNLCKFDTSKQGNYVWGSLYLVILATLAFGLILYLIFTFSDIDKSAENLLTLVLLLIVIIGLNCHEYLRKVFITQQNIKPVLLSDFINYLFRIVGVASLSILGLLNINSVFFIIILSLVFGSIFFKNCLPRKPKNAREAAVSSWNINFQSAKWLLPAGLMQWTSVNLFISTAAFLISPAAVAILRVCQSLLGVLNVFVQASESIIPVKAAHIAHDKGNTLMWRYIVKVSLLGAGGFFLVVLVCSFFGSQILMLFFGKDYADSGYYVLLIYAISYIFLYLTIPLRAALRVMEKTDIWFKAYLFSSVVSLGLVYWLEVNYEALGASVGILVAYIVLVLYSYISLKLLLEKR